MSSRQVTGPHLPVDEGEPRRRLLVIAPDPRVRDKIAEGARRIEDSEVVAAGSLAEARDQILADTPQLVLSSLALPDGDGIQIFGALMDPDLGVSTTFMSRCLRRFREHLGHILRAADPKDALDRGIQCDCGDFSRRPLALSLTDAIALGALQERPVAVELVRHDRILGRVVVAEGQIRVALDAEGDGVAALRRLLTMPRVLVTCRAAVDDEWSSVLQIGRDWRQMLLDFAPDHWRADLEPSDEDAERDANGLLRTPLCTDDERLADAEARFDELLEKGLDAVLDRRFADAAVIFGEAQKIRPDDGRVVANLARLRDLGVDGCS